MRTAGISSERGSSFACTCNRLSKYMREKGSLPELSLGIAGFHDGRAKSNSHLAIFPTYSLSKKEVSDNFSGIKSMDLFPQQSGFGPTLPTNKPNSGSSTSTDFRSIAEQRKAQMTIFYDGKMVLIDDVSAEKAKIIMLMAANGAGCPQNSGSVPLPANTSSSNHRSSVSSKNFSDMPMARKASLQRFLEKRKDRIKSTAPFPPKPVVKSAEKPAWLDNSLGPQAALNPLGLHL
ncbi:protein TIFY 10b isoform X1 [Amborella trichopoda]|uniref:Protein TIFY n=1 Tax=Amborella trichopoda TaxID=13333 RepID=W1NV33_AMBTC|nr:protein TIFY 10b isoform X1 [Amborella trichopoda]ERM99472.1 hypothetical protein AMTR_s00131p00119200 [Amborella trichopoda]|eukprot:XP_006836619.1 protein TIFY 10b isoform X1 [Amborella trichopoda]